MKHDDQRDASIDTFLRSSLRSGKASPGSSGPCVEPEALAAWAEGTLAPRQAAAVETHVANCAACQQILAVFARAVPVPVESGFSRTRWHLRWAIPMTAAATAVAIWVAVPDDRREPIQDAFAVPDSAPSSEPSQPAAKSEADAAPPPGARERSESLARRDSDSSLRAQAEKREARQEEEADRQGVATESARAAPPTAAAASSRVAQGEAPLADATAPAAGAPAAPAAARSAAVAQQRRAAEAFAPFEVVSPDPNVRWRILATGQLEKSINAGQTWEGVALQLKVADIRAVSATTAIATTVDGRQFRTDDQGRTWNPVQK